jgi:hypothetical protein
MGMLELNLPCPTCGTTLLLPDAEAAFECRACGEQLRAFANDTARGVQKTSGIGSAYAGAVRYVVMHGNPEEHLHWQVRYEELRADHSRLRRSRIRWYLITALVLVSGIGASVLLGLLGGWSDSRSMASAVGLTGVSTLVLVILMAAVGSHYQRLEMRSQEFVDIWRMREPLHGANSADGT